MDTAKMRKEAKCIDKYYLEELKQYFDECVK